MKKIISILVVSFLFISLGKSHTTAKPPKKILGQWNIEKVVLKSGMEDDVDKYIRLKKGGILEGGRIGEKSNKKGIWKYKKKNKILRLDSKEGNRDDGDYKILKLTKKEMIITRNDVKIYLTKNIKKEK